MAEAAAARAAAEAEQAQAAARKAVADALTAEASARKAEAENADHDTPPAQEQRSAQARQKTAEAERDAAAARAKQVGMLIPDMSAVKDSTLDVKDGTPPVWGTALVYSALRQVADRIAERIARRPVDAVPLARPGDRRADLATADQAYHDVTTGLSQLEQAATEVLDNTDPATRWRNSRYP